MTNNKTISFYFHIPFCVRKCNYCDFLSAPSDEETKNAYMQALYNELVKSRKEYDSYLVTSIFFGGGTPSVVDPKWIEKILSYIREQFQISDNIEITVEVNPGTATPESLMCYKRAGVNRLSFGLQSCNNTLLHTLGRIHTYEQFLDTYKLATDCGFDNVNVDIMGALPNQDMEDYRETLRKVISLQPAPKHISLYSLILEEGTVFWDWHEKGKLIGADEMDDALELHKTGEEIFLLPKEDTERSMYAEGDRLLQEAGYRHYEISNYAKEGFECRHNCGYWTRQNYVGFGIGAASLVENVRFQNTSDLQKYMDCFGSGNEQITMVREELKELTREEQMEEFMFLGLRMMKGISKKTFMNAFGVPVEAVYQKAIRKLTDEGLLVAKDDSDKIYLTEKGIDLDNYVSTEFLLT